MNAIILTMAFAKRRPTHLHLTMPEDITACEKYNQAITKDEQNCDVTEEGLPKKVTFAMSTIPERKRGHNNRPPSPHPNKRTGRKKNEQGKQNIPEEN